MSPFEQHEAERIMREHDEAMRRDLRRFYAVLALSCAVGIGLLFLAY